MFKAVFLSCWQYGYGSPQVSYLAEYFQARGASVLVFELREPHKKRVKAPYRRFFIYPSPLLSLPIFALILLWSYFSKSPVLVTTSLTRRWIKLLSRKTKIIYYGLEVTANDSKQLSPLLKRFKSFKVIAPNKWRLNRIIDNTTLSDDKKHTAVVPNFAPLCNDKFYVKSGAHVLIQGQIAHQTYGLELLQSLSLLNPNVIVSIYGALDSQCAIRLDTMNLPNVTYYGHAPRSKISAAQRSANIGICFWRPTDFSTEYAAPNKLYEFLSMGIACISSSNKSLIHLFNEHPYGVILTEISPRTISDQINMLADNPALLSKICISNKEYHQRIANFQNCYPILDRILLN